MEKKNQKSKKQVSENTRKFSVLYMSVWFFFLLDCHIIHTNIKA